MNYEIHDKNKSYRQSGLTLIELMIAIFLTSFILIALFKIFDANFEYYKVMKSDSSLQDSSRAATFFISRDLRDASALGCLDAQAFHTKLSVSQEYADNPTPVYFNAAALALSLSIEEREEPMVTFMNNVAAGMTIDGVEVEEGTDILIVKTLRKLTTLELIQRAASNDTKLIFAEGSLVPTGHLIAMECWGLKTVVELVSVDNVKVDGGNVHATLTGPITGNFPHQKTDDGFPVDAQSVSFYAPQRIVYFVGASTLWNHDGSTSLSLYRQLNNVTSEVVTGIEDLQLRGVALEDETTEVVPDDTGNSDDDDAPQIIELPLRYLVDGDQMGDSPERIGSVMVDMVVSGDQKINIMSQSDGPSSPSSNTIFNGISHGKKGGDPYDLDGRMRRVVSFTSNIRSRQILTRDYSIVTDSEDG